MRLRDWFKISMVLCLALGMMASLSFAQEIQINFEAFPTGYGVPADEMEVFDQYKASNAVTFIIDKDGNPNTTDDRSKPLLEDRGGTVNPLNPLDPANENGNQKGFRYDKLKLMDIEAQGFEGQLGNFFLKLNTDAPADANLLVEFLKPAQDAFGWIWDIDADASGSYEKWSITGYTKENGVYVPIGTTETPTGLIYTKTTSLDGKPFSWAFKSSNYGNKEVYAVKISFTGNRKSDVGLAFDQLRVLFKQLVIDAVADDYSNTPISGTNGGTTSSVLTNDTLNGEPVNPTDITLTPGTAPTPAAGSISMNPDGTISVASGTTAGTYSYSYTICEAFNPTNCDETTVTIIVTAPVIGAVDDDYSSTPISGTNGGTTDSVLTNDTLDGEPVNPADITLTPGTAPTPAAGSITMNADGTITVAPDTTAGTYTYPYTICDKLNPTTCDTAVATIVVTAPVIDAVDDDYSSTPISGTNGGTTSSVLTNDTLNGEPVNPADITLTPGTAPTPATGSITMNADGTITVAPDTTSGTYTYPYTICDKLNPTTCDTAVATIVVTAPVIDAVDDDYSSTPISGTNGGTTSSVLTNDTLNSEPVNPADITLTPGTAPTPAAGSITMNADGTITVAPDTTAGTYTYPYTICDKLNPTTCDTAVATIVVTAPVVTPPVIDAVDDDYSSTPISGTNGGTTSSVLTNDTLNGEPFDPTDVTLTPGTAPTPAAGSITMNADGTITVAPGTTAGTYEYPYTICDKLNPTTCDTAVATIVVSAPVVTPPVIDAVDDDYSSTPISGTNGGTTSSVLTNDTLNSEPVNPADITLTPGTAPTPAAGSISMNPDGTITVAPGTTAGTYEYPYTICDTLNPTTCDTAVATIVVSAPVVTPPVIDAVDDDYSSTPISGTNGGTTSSVLTNDTLNSEPVNPADITLTPGTAPTPAAGSISMNPDGTITVAPGTTAGTYEYPYTICDKLNPTTCDTAVATIVVTAPVVVTPIEPTVSPAPVPEPGTLILFGLGIAAMIRIVRKKYSK